MAARRGDRRAAVPPRIVRRGCSFMTLDRDRRGPILSYQTAPLERPAAYPQEAGAPGGELAWAVIAVVAGAVWLVILFPMLRLLISG